MPARRGFQSVVTALLAALLAAGAMWDTAHAADVHGDDTRDVYVGTGGLLLPSGSDDGTRRQVAGCAGCRWRLTTPCLESTAGNSFDDQSICASVVRGCPGGRLLRTWFEPAGAEWRDLGVTCVGEAGPVTVADVATAVAARVEQVLPPLAPAAQPTRGVLAQIPVSFRSSQPAGPQAWSMVLLGQRVTITAAPRWRWSFGDGAAQDTARPGGRYPDMAVRHAYRHQGVYEVSCAARWVATFSVEGLGPFPVTESIEQGSAFRVTVGEGRALLTGDPMAQ